MLKASYPQIELWAEQPYEGPNESQDFAITLEANLFETTCRKKSIYEVELQVILPERLPFTDEKNDDMLADIVAFVPDFVWVGIAIELRKVVIRVSIDRDETAEDVPAVMDYCRRLNELLADISKRKAWDPTLIHLSLANRTDRTTVH